MIEYLQTEVTTLRAGQFKSDPISLERNALADHVETMLTEHEPTEQTWHKRKVVAGCKRCRYRIGRGSLKTVPAPCLTLRSLASLISTVTGTPIPEGAQ